MSSQGVNPLTSPAGGPPRVNPVLEITIDDDPSQVVELAEAVVTIGRSVDNVLEVPDPNMSRRHCVIEKRGADVILTDCNSSNGTRVNDQPVVSQRLRNGDEISCGSTVMRFAFSLEALRGQEPRTRAGVDSSGGFDQEATARGRGGLAKKSQVAVLAHERDDLRKLLEIIKRLNQVHDLRRLLEAIIDAAIELMAAERGFLILVNEGQMKIEIARNRDQTSIHESSLLVSTQICQTVVEKGEPVLTTNAASDDRFGRYKSVVGLKLRSILCVPFRIKDETFGTVYLDAGDVGAFSQRDVSLLSAFSDQAALAIENARLLHAARRKERIEQELKIATQIQKKLLPRKPPELPGLDLYGWMHAAKEVGGDYYDYMPTEAGQLLLCIGDVSGKGVPAGLVMASARSALRTLVGRTTSTREIVLALNRLLCEDLDQEMFLSFVVLQIDPGTGQVEYTGAGHETLLIYRAATGQVENLKTGGTVLGLVARLDSVYKEQRFQLQPGDGLFLYTDGVTETINEEREQYTLERLIESVARHGAQPAKPGLHGVLNDVLRFKGRQQQRDDLTLVVLKRADGLGGDPSATRLPDM